MTVGATTPVVFLTERDPVVAMRDRRAARFHALTNEQRESFVRLIRMLDALRLRSRLADDEWQAKIKRLEPQYELRLTMLPLRDHDVEADKARIKKGLPSAIEYDDKGLPFKARWCVWHVEQHPGARDLTVPSLAWMLETDDGCYQELGEASFQASVLKHYARLHGAHPVQRAEADHAARAAKKEKSDLIQTENIMQQFAEIEDRRRHFQRTL